jgi:hypothetical protein
MCDKEDAAAALWNSEVLSVKHPVGSIIPALCQEGEELAESTASIG